MRRVLLLLLTILLGQAVVSPRTASAAFIGLTTPVTGSHGEGDIIELTVAFDPNGSLATNIVSMDLYVAFSGLIPLGYQLGSLFTPYTADPAFFALDGLCSATMACMYPEGSPDSAEHYQALASVPAPHAPSGPGSLFTMRFAVAPGSTAWMLNLFGDPEYSLLWDPTPDQVCDIDDPNCDPSVPPIPFALVLPQDLVPSGLARINVGVNAPDPGGPTPVPEPATLVLLGLGLLALTARHRGRS